MNKTRTLYSSFSGGETSRFMTQYLLTNYSREFEIKVVFANTGEEKEETLDFINKCDKEWGFNTVWLECVVDPEKGKGTRHKIVDYKTASRNGEPYQEVIKKYGLPNQNFLHCTRELKEAPIKSYIESQGDKGSLFAMGIRLDETRRINPAKIKAQKENGIIYPLADYDYFPRVKEEILAWSKKQSFNLGLPEYAGNCKWCFKKSLKKLTRIAHENPEYFDFPKEMERKYSLVGSNPEKGQIRKLFRGHRTVDDILLLASSSEEYRKNIDEIAIEDATVSDCGESCEPFQEVMLYAD